MASNIFAKVFNFFKNSKAKPVIDLFAETDNDSENDLGFLEDFQQRPKDSIEEALKRAFEEAPAETNLKFMELHWPHSDTNFMPLLAFKWSNDEETFEYFERSLGNLDLESWAGKTLEFLCDKGFKPMVTFDRRNGIFTFEV